MADNTIGEILKQLEGGELSKDQRTPVLPSIEVAPVIKATSPDQAQNKSGAIVTAVKSSTGNLITARNTTNKSQLVEAEGPSTGGSIYQTKQETKQVKSDLLVKAIKDYFVPSKPFFAASKISNRSAQTGIDNSAVLNKMDEIKEVLKSNKKSERLAERQPGKILHASKSYEKKAPESKLLHKVFGKGLRRVMSVLPNLRTALSNFENVFADKPDPVAGMKKNKKEKAVQTNKAEREAQLANVLAKKVEKARKKNDSLDYVDSRMKKKPLSATIDDTKRTVQPENVIKEKRELIRSQTITAIKDNRELTTAVKPTIKKKDDVVAQVKAVMMQKMSAQVQDSNTKKQLDALITEFKGMRKDIKKQLDTPGDIQNPMLRETIIQSKNLFK